VQLDKAQIIEYMRSNITLMKWMIANGYEDKRTLGRRIKAVEAWIAKPELLKADAGAQYAAVIEIDLADVKEPIVACPNDPDDVKLLSEVSGTKIDEVFIGSCMTNISHFRAAGKAQRRATPHEFALTMVAVRQSSFPASESTGV
jgi:aconitate hydratase 2/2-methylisocitrate dehydratase